MRSLDRHTENFLIGLNDLISDRDNRLQRQFGIGNGCHHIGDLCIAVDGLKRHRFGVLTRLQGAFCGPFNEIGKILTGRLTLRFKSGAAFCNTCISADGAGDW